ncbi:MAG: CocE/NonD family hydrolase [Bacteroidia bacterium]|nr:CocE/NonD family hydrolase [Bacteroidia bacterium]
MFNMQWGWSQTKSYTNPMLKSDSELISRLANSVISDQTKASSLGDYNRLFKLQLVANRWKDAFNTIQVYQETYAKGQWAASTTLHYQVYALARELADSKQLNWLDAIRRGYDSCLSFIPPKLQYGFREYKRNYSPETSSGYEEFIERLAGQDTLNSGEAITLCIRNLEKEIYETFLPAYDQVLRQHDSTFFDITEGIKIKISEGVDLSALVVRKKDSKRPLPVILVYNIYPSEQDFSCAKRSALHNYVGVSVNTRGKRESKSELLPFEHETEDIFAIIDWISQQPWCNGQVGMMGGSYLGFSQWATTKKIHPALKTIVPSVAVNVGVDYPMHNHIFMPYMLRWLYLVTSDSLINYPLFANEKYWGKQQMDWYKSGVAFSNFDSLEGKRHPIFQKWLKHPSYDSFWRAFGPNPLDFSEIDIPVLTTTGYFDGDQVGALTYYRNHMRHNPNAEHYVVIGPFNHRGGQHYAVRNVLGYKIDEEANIHIHQLAYEWFDYVMKGKPKPAILKDKFNYQLMGTNTWRHCANLTELKKDSMLLYLGSKQNNGRCQLRRLPSGEERSVFLEVDLADRSDSSEYKLSGSWMHPSVSSTLYSDNSLIFESLPFTEKVDLNSVLSGKLRFRTNKQDFDLVMKLYELLPTGEYFPLSVYLQRMSYARNSQQRELLVPNEWTEMPIGSAYFSSKQIKKDSRLVLIVGVNKNPDWEINYGSGKTVSLETIKDAKEPILIEWSNKSWVSLGVSTCKTP